MTVEIGIAVIAALVIPLYAINIKMLAVVTEIRKDVATNSAVLDYKQDKVERPRKPQYKYKNNND